MFLLSYLCSFVLLQHPFVVPVVIRLHELPPPAPLSKMIYT